MPAVIPFIPLITGGLAAGAGIYGAHQASGAARDAARMEQDSTQQALADAREERAYERGFREEERDYNRGQYANYLERLEPYRGAGVRATGRLDSMLSSGLPASVPTSGGGQMVRMKAPNGQVREVPAAHEQWYLSRGARRV